jgi:phosphoribosylglycinamide formyltransferase 2
VPLLAPAASAVILGNRDLDAPAFAGVGAAFAVDPSVEVRLFGKPDARPGRRLGVALARAADADAARALATAAAAEVSVEG